MASGIVNSVSVRVGMDLANFDKGAKRAARTAGDLERAFTLKGALGKGSAIGQISSILKGGGAIAGLTLLARQSEHLTEAWAKAAQSGESMTGAILRQIPFLGSMIRNYENVQSALSGTAAAMDKAAAATKRVDAVRGLEQEISNRERLMGLSGDARKAMEHEIKLEGDLLRIKKLREAAIGANAPANELAAIDELDRRIRGLGFLEGGDGPAAAMLELVAAAQKQADTFGMTARQLAVYEARLAGLNEIQIASIDFSLGLVEVWEKEAEALKKVADEQKKYRMELDDSAKSVRDFIKSDVDRLNDFIDNLERLGNAGVLSRGEIERAIEKKQGELNKPAKDDSGLLSGSQFGSRQAVEAEIRAAFGRFDTDEVDKKQLKEQQEMRRILADAHELLRRGNIGVLNLN